MLGILLATASASNLFAASRIDYTTQIKPILKERCYACHGVLKQQSKLRLDTAEFLRQGGKHGAGYVSGKPDESHLVERISAKDESERMPPEGEPLKTEQIALIKLWIAQGAKAPAGEKPEVDPKDHWAFKAPVRPAVPKVKAREWAQNPIDAFIAAEHQERGLKPQSLAEKSLWLRRVYLDLTGLPPSLQEMREFEADNSTQAYEKVVDRLLASPQYGERWGRHFMDIWRYTDWYGLGEQLRYSQKHIWHWRDWIVESLNKDKGYDRMLVEMLAGDEIAPTDRDTLRATGFLARNYYLFNRTTWLDDVVEHTSKAFLGITMNCAKCHDHKYDPVSAKDYYAWRAFFEPYHVRLDELPGEPNLEKNGLPRAYDVHLDTPTYLHVRGDEKHPDKSKEITPTVPVIFKLREPAIKPVALPLESRQPGLRDDVYAGRLKATERELEDIRRTMDKFRNDNNRSGVAVITEEESAKLQIEYEALEAVEKTHIHRLKSMRSANAADMAKVQDSKSSKTAELVAIAARDDADLKLAEAELALLKLKQTIGGKDAKKKTEAEKKLKAAEEAVIKAKERLKEPGNSYQSLRGSIKALEGPDEKEDHRNLPFPTTSTGRRTALAQWIANAQNPLTARVAVNHLWLRHFGQPLVPTVMDFGRRGAAPTHSELLDWLATEFIEHGWSMKHMHRLMVLSRTYRLTSSNADAAKASLTKDAENKYYWRMNSVRMEAQSVRDSLLQLAGQLDLTMGGPTIDPKKEDTVFRRSLYFTHSKDDVHKFLETFDNANVFDCYRRSESVLPQQALALANSKLSVVAAGKLAEKLATANSAATDDDFIQLAYETILAVEPGKAELEVCAETLMQLRSLAEKHGHKDPVARARAGLVHALFNHNDFITVR
ncbi:MAG: PSD1 and planctomycete cytochrome C domain-containing protein [Verrucomicrobiota bacterium]